MANRFMIPANPASNLHFRLEIGSRGHTVLDYCSGVRNVPGSGLNRQYTAIKREQDLSDPVVGQS